MNLTQALLVITIHIIIRNEETEFIDVTLLKEPDTYCKKCGYRWVKNVPEPKSCPDCKARKTARPIEKEVEV